MARVVCPRYGVLHETHVYFVLTSQDSYCQVDVQAWVLLVKEQWTDDDCGAVGGSGAYVYFR